MSFLNVDNLTINFGGLMALSNVSLAVEQAEIRGIIGPNGAGKTTLFNLVTGVHRPTRGRVFFTGREITRTSPHGRVWLGIARTYQTTQLFKTMTVLENVMVGRHCRSLAELLSSVMAPRWVVREEKDIQERAVQILVQVGLAEKRDELARNLPYGQQRILELARALATEPSLLLLDEPSAGMTLEEGRTMMGIIERLREQGMTILVVEHDMRVVMGISDRVSVLNFGELIAEGSPEQIQRNRQVIEAYLGSGG